ncbi:MAG: hypothetical protein M3Z22_01255 [Verrucomicrobiota bacterium]|nr:hypothetical protein [Verrucomicrobiota bacterium]
MASTTYPVIRDQPNLSRFTMEQIEQIDKAFRKARAAFARKSVPAAKVKAPAKERRVRTKR